MPTIAATREKIEGFRNIPEGWHFGEGIRPSDLSVDLAHLINEAIGQYTSTTDAFLGVGGQIQVNGYFGHRFMELILEDGRVYFLLEKDGRPIFEEKNKGILDAISRICYWGAIWATSEYSIRIISTVQRERLPMLHSSNPALGEFLLLTANAFMPPVRNFAPISGPITRTLVPPANPQFTSSSPQNTYQRRAST